MSRIVTQMATLLLLSSGYRTHQSYVLHTAVSCCDDPVLVDQRSSTEVESRTILQVRRCTLAVICWSKFKGVQIVANYNT